MRLLIVEDSAPLAEAVARHLTAQGHAVDRAATLAEAEDAVAVAEYALILLDLGLPDGSGLGFLRARRAAQDRTPIVIATARDQISDRIAGLDAGADDYVVKPYDLEELAARIRANARRGQDSPATVIDLGGVTVDRARRRVHAGGAEVRLTQREWALFDTLLGAPRPGARQTCARGRALRLRRRDRGQRRRGLRQPPAPQAGAGGDRDAPRPRLPDPVSGPAMPPAPPPRAQAGYSLTRRLSLRVLALTGAGWLLAVAVAIAVLDHETGETLDDALGHEAQLLAAMAANGAALPALRDLVAEAERRKGRNP